MDNIETSFNDGYEDENEKSRLKGELEEILKTVPYSLGVALIKISQINDYVPLELEKYYQNIMPTFHLLRRTDGSKYQSNSIKTVRSAMVSNRLFTKNENGLYELNIKNALNYLKLIQKKKGASENELFNPGTSNNLEENVKINNNVRRYKKRTRDKFTFFDDDDGPDAFPRDNDFLGKKRRLKDIKKAKERCEKRRSIRKYERGFELLTHLLTISSNDNNLLSKLNFDLEDISETTNLTDKNPNINKIIGMLTVFKFFKPFLEKSFSSIRIQNKIIEKISEINTEVNCMDTIYKAQE